jgi:hypothetical protein
MTIVECVYVVKFVGNFLEKEKFRRQIGEKSR